MTKQESIKLFEEKKVRTIWDDEQEKWYFSVVDVVGVLTASKDFQTSRKYWNKLKERLKIEGFEPVTNCHQLKLQAADGKKRLTDIAEPSSPIKKQVITSYPIKMSRIKMESKKMSWLQDVTNSNIISTIGESLICQCKF